MALFGMLIGETRIDRARRIVERHWKLFGRFSLWHRTFSLETFCFIGWQCWRSGEGHTEPNTWRVGLERCEGKELFVVQWFHVARGSQCTEPKEFARELSELTGLPLRDEIKGA